jgi:hypothetical protein
MNKNGFEKVALNTTKQSVSKTFVLIEFKKYDNCAYTLNMA